MPAMSTQITKMEKCFLNIQKYYFLIILLQERVYKHSLYIRLITSFHGRIKRTIYRGIIKICFRFFNKKNRSKGELIVVIKSRIIFSFDLNKRTKCIDCVDNCTLYPLKLFFINSNNLYHWQRGYYSGRALGNINGGRVEFDIVTETSNFFNIYIRIAGSKFYKCYTNVLCLQAKCIFHYYVQYNLYRTLNKQYPWRYRNACFVPN